MLKPFNLTVRAWFKIYYCLYFGLLSKMSSPLKIIASKEDQQSLLDKFDTFLFDCDGVLWEGTDAIYGSTDAIKHLLSLNKQLIFVTNNSSKSRKQYASKFVQLGFPPVDPKNITTSGSSAAFHAAKLMGKNHWNDGKSVVFYIGLEALGEELNAVGLQCIWASQLELPKTLTDWKNFSKDSRVRFNVVQVSLWCYPIISVDWSPKGQFALFCALVHCNEAVTFSPVFKSITRQPISHSVSFLKISKF